MKFKIYDYNNNAIEVDTGDEPINLITVTILSGDETGLIVFEDGTTQAFDASECRCINFFDGQYVVPGTKLRNGLLLNLMLVNMKLNHTNVLMFGES